LVTAEPQPAELPPLIEIKRETIEYFPFLMRRVICSIIELVSVAEGGCANSGTGKSLKSMGYFFVPLPHFFAQYLNSILISVGG